MPRRTRRFQLSALQALVFNRVLAARMAAQGLDALWSGDLARRHGERRLIEVSEAQDPAPPELSATGPLPGTGERAPSGRAAELEREAAAASGLDPAAVAALPKALAPAGARRPLRVPVLELDLTFEEDRGRLAFVLPPGSFATTLLEELKKEHSS